MDIRATIGDIYNFFAGDGTFGADGKPTKPSKEQKEAYKLAKFRIDWAELTDIDKRQISEGIGNQTLTYA